jgi:hypothetical protein
MLPLSVTVSTFLIMRIVGLLLHTPPNPARLMSFYYYSQLVHIDQTIYDTTRIDHLIYVSNFPNQISLMTLRMRRLDKTQTKTPPDKCWDTLRIGVYKFFIRIDQLIYVFLYNKRWSSTSSPKSRENFILNPNCECTNNGGLPLVSNQWWSSTDT